MKIDLTDEEIYYLIKALDYELNHYDHFESKEIYKQAMNEIILREKLSNIFMEKKDEH